MPVRLALFFATMAIAVLSCTGRASAQYVPYYPTPQAMVDRMLEAAEVKESDFLIDLGCGDGRIPITAARRYGTPGLGVDITAQRIVEATSSHFAGWRLRNHLKTLVPSRSVDPTCPECVKRKNSKPRRKTDTTDPDSLT